MNEAKSNVGSPVTPHQEGSQGRPLPGDVLDSAIARLLQSPLCCHCGSSITGAIKTNGKPFLCPACDGIVRCVRRGIWLERVSPLDPGAPTPMRN